LTAQAADILDFLDEKMRLPASSLGMASLRPELSEGLRGFPVGDYRVFYREADLGIEIVRVLHPSRDIAALFPAEDSE
jgi:toxin ParE1/3/4